MITRCYSKKSGSYPRYGGIGIKVCDAWLNSFTKFLDDVGFAPSFSHQLDRVDPTKNYEPGNVRWVTAKENVRNRRNTNFVEFEGQTRALSELCETYGVNLKKTEARLKAGWNVEDSIKLQDGRSRDALIGLMQAICQKRELKWSTVIKRLRRGKTVAEAFRP